MTDELTSFSYKWPAIVRCVESKNLFMVYPSEATFNLVPKRSFLNRDELLAFQNLMEVWATGRTNAFPVVQTPSQHVVR